MNRKAAFVNYMIDHKLKIRLQDDGAIVTGTRGGNRVVGKFDAHGRLLKISGHFGK